jgi:hypothetical protein
MEVLTEKDPVAGNGSSSVPEAISTSSTRDYRSKENETNATRYCEAQHSAELIHRFAEELIPNSRRINLVLL